MKNFALIGNEKCFDADFAVGVIKTKGTYARKITSHVPCEPRLVGKPLSKQRHFGWSQRSPVDNCHKGKPRASHRFAGFRTMAHEGRARLVE